MVPIFFFFGGGGANFTAMQLVKRTFSGFYFYVPATLCYHLPNAGTLI